jgi:hypothetical protein
MVKARRRLALKHNEAAVDGTALLSDAVIERVLWVSKPYLPRGGLVLLDGPSDELKRLVAQHIAGTLSRGARWPTTGSALAATGNASRVLYLGNGPRESLKAALASFGADLALVHFFDARVRADEWDEYQRCLALRPLLMVIDPIDAGLCDQDSTVAFSLDAEATRRGCALLCIREEADRLAARGRGLEEFACSRLVIHPQGGGDARIVHAKSRGGRTGLDVIVSAATSR